MTHLFSFDCDQFSLGINLNKILYFQILCITWTKQVGEEIWFAMLSFAVLFLCNFVCAGIVHVDKNFLDTFQM